MMTATWMRSYCRVALASMLMLAGACKRAHMPPPADSTGAVAVGVGAAQDSGATEELRRLEREAAALATVTGCEQGGDCRTAPVGSRPCGGPRYYLVYCARTTDSVSLYRKLDELSRAERAYNERTGLASTCEMRLPPELVASGGSCRAEP